MMISKLVLVGLSLAIIVLASGCSSGASGAPADAANAPAVTAKPGAGTGKSKEVGGMNGAHLAAPGGPSPLGSKAGGGN